MNAKIINAWKQYLRPWNGNAFPREFGLSRDVLISEDEYIAHLNTSWNTGNNYCSVYSDRQIEEHKIDSLFIEGRDWVIEGGLNITAMNGMLNEAKDLVNKFKKFALVPRVYFSGGRGMHYYIDFKPVRIRYFRSVVNKLLGMCNITNSQLDTHVIGNMRAMARIPCTKNERTNLFSIPVDMMDTPENVLKRSWKCDPYELVYENNEDFEFWLEDADEEASKRMDYSQTTPPNGGMVGSALFPPCIIEIISKIKETGYASNSERIHLTAYGRQAKWDQEQAVNIFRHLNDFKESLTRYHVNYVYGDHKTKCYGCRKAKVEHMCPVKSPASECPFYPSINVRAFGDKNGSNEDSG